MRQVKEEFGTFPPSRLKEPYGPDEYIVRKNLRTEPRTKEDGTIETVYVCDSTIYTNIEYIEQLENRNENNSEAIAELADILLGGINK